MFAIQRCAGAVLLLVLVSGVAWAEEPASKAPEDIDAAQAASGLIDHVTVRARGDDLTGIATSATEGATSAEDLSRRPLLRSGEIVETIPGVIATQHSGGGKANQYFLRGFNLDHGTDLRIAVEGMQVNLPTHGHGQGYADASFLIPELIDTVRYRKGNYDVATGDFSAAGATDIELVDALEHPRLQLALGQDDYQRLFGATDFEAPGGRVLAGFEYSHHDGPWVRPDDFVKINGMLRYLRGDEQRGWSLSAMGYDGDWNATDQIPRRAAGVTVDRFGAIDPTLGGKSSRYSMSGELHRSGVSWTRELRGYVLAYELDLLSNFTYCLDGGGPGSCALDDDQFLQRDERTVLGARYEEDRAFSWGRRPVRWRAGAELQFHLIDNGLFRTEAGEIRTGAEGLIRQDEVDQLFSGAFADVEVRWTERARTVTGLRIDRVDADVASSLVANSGTRDDAIASPKLAATFGPWKRTELYLDYGMGFHSNDARGMMTTIDPVSLDPVRPADPLVRTETADVGVRTTLVPGLQTTLTAFWIRLDSELVFVGDAGTTEPGPPSRRTGLELTNFYRARPWLAFDFDITVADAEFTDVPEGEHHIPGALEETVAAGVAFGRDEGLFGSLRWRYFSGFPLIEDGSVRGSSTSLVNARIGYGFRGGLSIVFDVFNLLDREDEDIQYFYASRLPAELSPNGVAEPVEGVEDVHFHPMEPRSLRAWLEYQF